MREPHKFNAERKVFLTNGAGTTGYEYETNEPQPLPFTAHKNNNWRQITGLNKKSKNYKARLEEYVYELCTGKCFLEQESNNHKRKT